MFGMFLSTFDFCYNLYSLADLPVLGSLCRRLLAYRTTVSSVTNSSTAVFIVQLLLCLYSRGQRLLLNCYTGWETAQYFDLNRHSLVGYLYSISFFYRASICEGGVGSHNSVRLSVSSSVRLSVTRMDCDKSKWCTADILIPHERAITLLLWHQQWLDGDAPFPLKSALKVTHPLRKTPTSTDFRS